MNRLVHFSWILALLSIGLFVFLVSSAGTLESLAAGKASVAASQAQELDKTTYAKRIHALALDTKDERGTLDGFAHLDIVSTVQTLEGVGKSTGVSVAVTDVTPEGGGTTLSNGEVLQQLSFALSADGTYNELMHAEDVYEHLPLASQIVQFDLARAADSPGGKQSWHMTLHIQVLAIAASL